MSFKPPPLYDKLYFLAFYKHGKPQSVVAGPWADPEDATEARLFHPFGERLVVVSTELPFQHEPAYD